MTEADTQKAILDYLKLRGILAFRVNSGMAFRVGADGSTRPIHCAPKGSSDIVAILPPDGRFWAIEVKSRKGKTTPEQEAFLAEVREQGGVAIIARSLDDVIELVERGV